MKYFSFLLLFFALIAQGDVDTVSRVIGVEEGETVASANLIIPGASSSGLTYNATLIEFTTGSAKLKNQFADDVVFAAKLGTDDNAIYSKNGGSLNGSTTGTITYGSSKAILTAGGVKYIDYAVLNNFPIGNIAAVRMKVTVGYTGSPATNQRFFYASQSTISDLNRFDMAHLANGNVMLNAQESNGGVAPLPFGAWAPTSSVEYEILGELNFTSGDHRIFVDGEVKGAVTGATATRPFGAGVIHIGTGYDESDVANFSVRDLVIYNATQYTAGYTPGYTVPSSIYSLTDPTIKNTTAVTASAYLGFTAGTTVTGSDLIKYQMEVGGQAKYYNGSAWVNSDGSYAQSNTADDMNTHVVSLAAGATRVIAVLHSADGTTTPALTYAELIYEE
jgi:hypothetical protein